MNSKNNNPQDRPPRWAERFLGWFCNPELLPEIQGDLHELFQRKVTENGLLKARWWYLLNILSFFRPFAIKREKSAYTINHTDMLKNYFKIAFRNLLSKKFYSAINILGLSIGMTCCMLIFLYVSHELSYDKFHTKASRIYRLVTNIKTPTETGKSGVTSAPVAPTLKADFPEVEKMVRLRNSSILIQRGDVQFQEDDAMMADSAFFEVFDFQLLQGNPHMALVAPFSVVLTKDAARKYFGEENPMGQRLRMDNTYDMTVTGVMQNVPENSHFTFDILISMSTLLEKMQPEREEQWGSISFLSYVLLSGKADPEMLEAKLPAFLEKYMGTDKTNVHYSLLLEPLKDVYLHSDRYVPKKGNLTNLYIFSIIAGFILLIACINFMNLSTARATERAKEVGIRKVIGALRRQLTVQFLSESVLLSLFAFALASIFSELLLPIFNQLSGKIIAESIFYERNYLLLLFLLALGVGVLTGIYPALVLSRFKPTVVLKGRFSSSQKGVLLRKGLVVVQFMISIMLIAGTVIVYLQLDYMRSEQLGFKKEQMLVVDFRGDEAIQEKIEIVKRQLSQVPQVLSASASLSIPGRSNYSAYTVIENPEGEMQETAVDLSYVDDDFIDQYQIALAAGRNFSPDFPADTSQALIINEAAAASLGYASPEEVIGKRFSQWGKEGQIVGVVKDYHFRSLQEEIIPLTFSLSPEAARFISLNIQATYISETIAKIEQKWQEIAPHRPFDYFFLDEAFDQQYKTEVRFGQLFLYFAGLAIFIACLGLLGLISYTVVQRTREIGIRKVLGATESSIVRLLSKDFLTLIFFAFIIASPIAWYILKQWLSHFAFRIEVEWWVFALAGLLALMIALLTVSFQTIKAAVANPVESLRNE